MIKDRLGGPCSIKCLIQMGGYAFKVVAMSVHLLCNGLCHVCNIFVNQKHVQTRHSALKAYFYSHFPQQKSEFPDFKNDYTCVVS